MKKLMTIAAAALCASVFADGITSANVVGYRTVDLKGKQYNSIAPGFLSADKTDGTFQMKNIQPSSFDETSDTLQFLENTRARVTKTYFYYESAWYEDVDDWNAGDDDTFDVFQGFLGNFAAKDVAFQSSGKVLDKPIQIDCATDKLQYVMIGNPLPVDISFKDIEAVTFDETSDTLQLLDETRARVIKTYFAYKGTWYENVDDWIDASDDVFEANTSMLGNFAAKDVVLNFPGAL